MKLKSSLKKVLLRILLPYLRKSNESIDKLLATSTDVYFNKATIENLDVSLNSFYATFDIDNFKSSEYYSTLIKELSISNYKTDVLRFDTACPKRILYLQNIWKKKLFLTRNCKVRLDLLTLPKGKQIPPHAHISVLSGFIVLEGSVAIRHYNVSEYLKYGVKCIKTIDKVMTSGDFTTNTENKDNIHWLNGNSDRSILLRFNMTGLQTKLPDHSNLAGRFYLNPSKSSNDYEFSSFISAAEIKDIEFN